MSEANQLRLIIAVIGALLLFAIWWFGTRKPRAQQGKRVPGARGEPRPAGRVEPTLGDEEAALPGELREEIDRLGASIRRERSADAERADDEITWRNDDDTDGADDGGARDDAADADENARPSIRAPQRSPLGARPNDKFDRIVTLHVLARPGEMISGGEWVVAAEKIGLIFGDMDIFHRLVEGRPEAGPVFSVASRVKPGSFELASIGELRFPGLTFFMTLPGPMSALDAWDTMLPAAQRAAELLDAQLLDENQNALGRQTIQHLRDDLRAYDRAQERNTIKRPW
jgi:cell division protein ZipA